MNIYTIISKMYDILDCTYFANVEKSPRRAINELIPDKDIKLVDMCCGTLANSIPIAKSRSKIRILGVDLSKQMLQVARRKIRKEGMKNISLKCSDATNTGITGESFDYAVIGLALHEMSPQLQREILKEAYRLLKPEGKLIVLEWEKQKKLVPRILHFPLLVLEQICNRSFLEFFRCDKQEFFSNNGFELVELKHCSYSVVMEFEKRTRANLEH